MASSTRTSCVMDNMNVLFQSSSNVTGRVALVSSRLLIVKPKHCLKREDKDVEAVEDVEDSISND